LDALAPCQKQIEDSLYGVSRRQTGPAPTVVLYEVTSSYFEGECHALAACGYNRAKKAGKPQIVIGLVTTGHGEPIAVHVFDGKTADPLTGPTPVEELRTRFGITGVVLVGARDLVKSTWKTVRAAVGYQYITALTTSQVRTRLREGVVRLAWLTPHVYEVQHSRVRLVLRRSEVGRRQAERRRYAKRATLNAWMTARHAGLRTLHAWGTLYNAGGMGAVVVAGGGHHRHPE
jgi:hypothetical protein